MSEKTFLYNYGKEDLNDLANIEKKSFKKANDINDKLLDVKILLDELNDDFADFMQFLEDERISKYCEFKYSETVKFDEELLSAISTTLKQSLNDTNKALNYNSKKIKINQIING